MKLEVVHFEDLTLTVCSAVRAGDVGRNAAFALRTGLELRGTPAIGAATHFLLHLGGSTLRNGHGFKLLIG